MAPFDEHIAAMSLREIEAAWSLVKKSQILGDPEFSEFVLDALYLTHGEPFGADEKALTLWLQFGLGTTDC